MTRIFLLRFFESYFRHRWLFLLPILLTTIAGSVFLYIQEPKYTSNGILYVNNQSLLNSLAAVPSSNTNWWLTPAQASSNEINNLLKTNAFIRAIVAETDLELYMSGGQNQVQEIIGGVRKSLWVTPVGNNEIYLQASFEDPVLAHQIVNSMVTSYINWQINKEVLDSQVAKNFFDELITLHSAELNSARQNLREYYEAHPVPFRAERPFGEQMEIQRLQSEIDIAAGRLESALHKAENANLTLQQVESDVRQTYLLLDAPLVPERPDISRRKMAVQLGIFAGAGLLLTVIGVAGSTILDRSFRFPIDIKHHLQLPVVAVVPDVTPRRKRGRQAQKARETYEEEIQEALPEPRTAFSNIQLRRQEKEERMDLSI
jgi:uncharacterized protein involved in exopolysaccharide biosynthesis